MGQEDPLEEGIATHSSIFAWRIALDRGTWKTWGCKELDMTEQLSTHSTHIGTGNHSQSTMKLEPAIGICEKI